MKKWSVTKVLSICLTLGSLVLGIFGDILEDKKLDEKVDKAVQKRLNPGK